MQKLTTCLWFNFNAEEAVQHYVGIFNNSKVLEVSRYGDAVPELRGKVLTMRFTLDGQEFLALNGGPQFQFNEAISIAVDCKDQAEVDALWQKLCEGGAPSQCGWLKDKFGLSWQVVPTQLTKMLNDKDPAKAQRVMAAVMQMSKLDIAALRAAYEGH